MRTLVTGASGFIGSAVVHRLHEEGHEVTATARRPGPCKDPQYPQVHGVDLASRDEWEPLLEGVEIVIHTAARVHHLRDTVADPVAAYRRVNVEGTVNLARAAARAGVRRFVFVSSIKVNGESTDQRSPFRPGDHPQPQDPYGRSKLEAELALSSTGTELGMEVTIVRPPLVYGPNVKANFRSLVRLVDSGIPLPFGAVRAKRSYVALENLVDLLRICARHPAAADRVLLVRDGEDLCLPELLSRIGFALGRPARLLSVSPTLLRGSAKLIRREDLLRRLLGSLVVDDSDTRELLAWTPPIDVNEAIQDTVDRYLVDKGRAPSK